MSILQFVRELTIYEFELFSVISARDLLTMHNGPNGTGKKKQSEMVKMIIDRFNTIGHWVATDIVLAKDMTTQQLILRKFIKLARKCLLLNNFNSLMEILSGLNQCSVQRLKGLWRSLPQRYRNTFQMLEKVMDPRFNFATYRSELRKREAPILPYFGMAIRYRLVT